MDIFKSFYHILSKFIHDIGYSVYKNFCRLLGYIIIFFVIGFCATHCTKAMTISNNLRTISDTQLELFKNISSRSNYKYYVATLDYTSSGYNNYYVYYLCLTNSDLNVTNIVNLSTSCNELYRYYSLSNNYTFEKVDDNNLTVNNSNYYTNYNDKNTTIMILNNLILFSIISFILYFIIISILRGF